MKAVFIFLFIYLEYYLKDNTMNLPENKRSVCTFGRGINIRQKWRLVFQRWEQLPLGISVPSFWEEVENVFIKKYVA